jgi:hypothetical protein
MNPSTSHDPSPCVTVLWSAEHPLAVFRMSELLQNQPQMNADKHR